ncbi:MAG: hypothetical protein KC481_08640 [Acidimicrobiaceae bacterium]|nr:hypothetical protein [Acidimicrobiaceae bacterium]MCO4833713.1 hypothetical protein [Acidimicrobiaceae bacterium]
MSSSRFVAEVPLAAGLAVVSLQASSATLDSQFLGYVLGLALGLVRLFAFT